MTSNELIGQNLKMSFVLTETGEEYEFDPVQAYTLALSKERPIVNGTKMPRNAQRYLALIIWEMADQKFPKDKGDIIKSVMEKRWPTIKWTKK